MFAQSVLDLLLIGLVVWCVTAIILNIVGKVKDKEIEKQKAELEKLKSEVDTLTTLNQVVGKLDELEHEVERIKK